MTVPAKKFPQAFPLVAGKGTPAVRWSDPGTCRTTDGFGPEDTYGLPTGPRNGVWVLDLDRKNGKDGVASLQALGQELPDTYTVRTRSGGLHLYWRWDDAAPVGNRVGVLEGVDVRGLGGYVRAGAGYPVVVDAPIADAPAWLVELVGTREEAPPAVSAVAIAPEHPEWAYRVRKAKEFLEHAAPCISGQGGQARLWAVCLRLSRTYELPVDTSVELLAPYNARCEPPWDAGELARTLARAAEHGQGPTGMFGEGFLAPATQGEIVPAVAPAGPWRRRPGDPHAYTFDMATAVAGGAGKVNPSTPKELAAMLTGPAAAPEWCGVWQYDVFRRRIVAVNPPFPLDAETVGLTTTDVSKIQVWCACVGVKSSLEGLNAAIAVAASCASFHPVLDYFATLPATPVAAARAHFDGIAGRLWGAPESRDSIESAHLQRLAVAAVRRVKVPGTKVDNMLILAGPQGYRKSGFCAKLFGAFFRDQMPDLASKDASIALEGYWGIEMAEMVSFSRASEAIKKEFLTRCEDKYRPVWAAATLVVPRQCVFIGTTNEDDFLRDPTGNTRYDVCDVLQPIDLAFSRDAFWSAAVALEAEGAMHYRDRAAAPEKSAESHHNAEDPWTDSVLRYCAGRPEAWVTASQALTYAVVVPLERQQDRELTRVKAILRRAFGPSRVRWVEERAQRVYVTRPESPRESPAPAP